MKLFNESHIKKKQNIPLIPHPIIKTAITTILERLKWFVKPFKNILILGPYGNLLKENSSEMQNVSTSFATTDIEYDCIISFFDLQTVNDVQAYLSQIKALLKPGGFFTAVFMGGESFLNLKNTMMKLEISHECDVSLRVHPSIHVADGAALMQNSGFACPMADIEKHTYKYDSLYALIEELRSWGATSHFYETPKIIQKICAKQIINSTTAFEEKIDLIYLTGLKPTSGERLLETKKSKIAFLK